VSEYLNKKLFEKWLENQYHDQDISHDRARAYQKALGIIRSGAFDADPTEVQHLRAALKTILYMPSAHPYVRRIAEEALSATSEPTETERVRDDEIGDWIDEKCPKCGADLLGNKVGDKWCSLVGCDYSINAPEKVGTEEWRHKYFGAEWPKVEGDGNDA